MRKNARPAVVKPELVNVGDMIEVRWEVSGVTYTMTAYVGAIKEQGSEITIFAANERTALVRYTPGYGPTWPHPRLEIARHRLAPNPLEGMI